MKNEHAKTKEILKVFEEITKIPRCSKNEGAICAWLMEWARVHKFNAEMDDVGNIVIKVPGSPGHEKAKPVVIQGHVDMVCEKTPDSRHDFAKDPIKLVFDGEWLTADRTTLGADNGIAIAMALVAALDKTLERPPLELLFTVDEETGLTGANALKPGFIKGKVLLNVDSEDEGYFTVGCAGGINTNLALPIKLQKAPAGYKQMKIAAGGMKGGHSGIDIDKEKANAIKVLVRVLVSVAARMEVRLADITGGTAHNAIPRDAEAVILVPKAKSSKVKNIVKESEVILKDEFKTVDPDLTISVKDDSGSPVKKVIPAAGTKQVLDFLSVIPHGVDAMSIDIKGLVETSNNLANVKIEKGAVKVLTSQRSSIVSRLDALTDRIEAVARLAGGAGKSGDGYPPWQPDMDSALLKKCIGVYVKMFNKKPVVEIIHAGLECGIIGDKNPGMDMISFGPTLKFPHSPDEKIHIGTIGKVWDFMAELLKNLC